MEIAGYGLMVAVLGLAIFFWGRGIYRLRVSDLIAGPAILIALCTILFVLASSSGVFSLMGALVMAFGIATLVLSIMVRPGSKFARRDVVAIGAGTIIAGFCLLTIL